nr:hypothetical protein [Tanacetum cinerariifolium]
MLIVVPFHNLEFGDSDDPPLGVYIESRFPVNCEPIELLTFSPLVRNSPKDVLVIVHRLLISPKILEVVVDEMFKRNYTTDVFAPSEKLPKGRACHSSSAPLAKFCANHDLVLVVSLAGKTIQDAEKSEQWVDLLHLF